MSLATKDMVRRYHNREQAAAVQRPLGLPPLPSAFGNVIGEVAHQGGAIGHQVEETIDLFSAQSKLACLCPPLLSTKPDWCRF